MKVLNLYAGIGGNRKLWEDVEVTAVEYDPKIAEVYQSFFPNDKVVVADAHQYLLDHYKEFDFIWSSPPCQSHSRVRTMGVYNGNTKAIYPDMKLYQEIIFLQYFSKGRYVVENVRPYYKTLVPANVELHRHLFWTNFYIKHIKISDDRIHTEINQNSVVYGVDLSGKDIKSDLKQTMLKNMVNPELAKYILDCARQEPEKQLTLEMK